MSVRQKIPFDSGLFFITFTCSHWLPLFELTSSYDLVYKWFDYLKQQGHYINAYVIMPNHIHAIIGFRKSNKSINEIIGDGKRFISYDIVKRLKEQNHTDILLQLSNHVNKTDAERKKKHKIFETSFDWKLIYTDKFMFQKMDYIHLNPCRSKLLLINDPIDYVFSSALNYTLESKSNYEITPIGEMKHIDLTIPLPQRALQDTAAGTTKHHAVWCPRRRLP